VLQRGLLILAIAVGFGAAAPAGGHSLPVVPEGVEIGGVAVGGLIAVQAREKLSETYGQTVLLAYGDKQWRARPAHFGASAAMDDAVDAAIDAEPNADVPLDVVVNKKAVRKYVRKIDRAISTPATNAELVGLRADYTPKVRAGESGRRVDRQKLTTFLLGALRSQYRGARITVPTVPVAPTVGPDDLGPVIVIRRGSNHLTLFDGAARVRDFTVATGAAQYPTPLGSFEIVVMERDPTWNPPDSDWAKDAKPIPPGPGNPLGTRWMGISAPAVGIHGTPDAASLGYSASHGCIRMAIPEAEWLFDHVEVGTPVYIVAA
jgi:lipoprotein-anchoring transpeptidase ErfK/SrfK